jgi:hypothetical protein
MPCMAGLPDGTYLIVGGGQHGVAGFGLGGAPNYNACVVSSLSPSDHFTVNDMANLSQCPLRPLKTIKPTHVSNGKHNRSPPLPQRSNSPPRRPRNDLRLRPNRKLQLTRRLLARRIPRRSLHATLHPQRCCTPNIHNRQHGLGVWSHSDFHEQCGWCEG